MPTSCIDLVISNLQNNSLSITSCPPLGSSDHLSIQGSIDLSAQSTAKEPLRKPPWTWNWNPEATDALRCSLEATPLLDLDEEQSCESIWTTWRSNLLQRAHLFCTAINLEARSPHHLSLRESPSLRRPWMTRELLSQIKLKHQLYRAYGRMRDTKSWQAFVKQRNLVTSLLRKAKSDFVESTAHLTDLTTSKDPYNAIDQPTPISTTNLHRMMKCLNTRPSNTIPDLQHNNETFTSSTDKATALNNFFISENKKSIAKEDQVVPPINMPRVSSGFLSAIQTTPHEVEKLLRSLDPTKSPGGDDIPTRLLKEVSHQVSPSLSHLFNLSFLRGELPQMWREATVTPLHKKGTKTSPTNYRPISLLSVVAKVQERIVHTRLYKHVDPHLPDDQSGFRKKDGTELQLLRLVHEISSDRDAGNAVAACFFDLSKAFDRVWHAGLLAKLEHMGVRDTALAWFKTYLCTRRQRVRVNDSTSPWQPIPAGVPQGSVLGPLLFVIYTADLPIACTNRHTKCSQFADDTALITTHPQYQLAQTYLQQAIDAAADWLKSWHLLVNPTKTVVMSFQRTQTLHLTLDNTQLTQVHTHRHLGLVIQSDLRWNNHIHNKINKARKTLFLLNRLRHTLNKTALTRIYKTYIRPILEYASLSLSNLPLSLHDKLERFQRRAARVCLRLPLFQHVHHTSLLFQLGLDTLSSRRQLRQITLAHNLHLNAVPPHLRNPRFCIPAGQPTVQLRHIRTYQLPTTKTTRHRDSPINASLSQYNRLPVDIRQARNIQTFKKSAAPLILSSICSCSSHPTFSFS